MRDEINEPLGQRPPPAPSRLRGFLAGLARALGVMAIAAVVAGGYRYWQTHSPDEQAMTVARREAPPKTPSPPPAAPQPAPTPEASAPPAANPGLGAVASAGEIDAASGVRVERGGGAPASSAEIIDVPQALGVRLPPAPDARLVEKSRFGLLPRIGSDGARPENVYARPVVQPIKLKNAARLAIVVGGLGLDAASTEAAISRLPAAISLGFAPYGTDLVALAARAREAGHEILLQAPMEAFGGAQPGPHTLLTAASEAENRDSLLWMMGRFPGYVGVENYLGGRFTADERAFAPALAEIAARGLAYLDDASSPRSLALSLAPTMNLRASEADVVIDASPTPEAIEAALGRLETLARRQDGAIGVATALPVSLDHIARWAAALEAHGIALTPVSALIGRAPMKSAGATP